MDNSIAPINHSYSSATMTTAAEAGKSGVKGLLKGGLWTTGIVAVLGIGLGIMTGGIGGVIIGLIGVGASPFIGTWAAGVGSAIGLAAGTYHGVNRVKQEQGAANVMQAQVAAYQAQAMAVANDNKYNLPEQGSQFNQAGSTVNAMQADGRVDGMQLQRA